MTFAHSFSLASIKAKPYEPALLKRSCANVFQSVFVVYRNVYLINRQLLQEYGRDPSTGEIARDKRITEDEVRNIINIAKKPLSLGTSISEEEDRHLWDFIPDHDAPTPEVVAGVSLR